MARSDKARAVLVTASREICVVLASSYRACCRWLFDAFRCIDRLLQSCLEMTFAFLATASVGRGSCPVLFRSGSPHRGDGPQQRKHNCHQSRLFFEPPSDKCSSVLVRRRFSCRWWPLRGRASSSHTTGAWLGPPGLLCIICDRVPLQLMPMMYLFRAAPFRCCFLRVFEVAPVTSVLMEACSSSGTSACKSCGSTFCVSSVGGIVVRGRFLCIRASGGRPSWEMRVRS